MHRRACLQWGLQGAVSLLIGAGLESAQAGAQQEEALSDAVRQVLASAIADRKPPWAAAEHAAGRDTGHRPWLQAADRALARHMAASHIREEFLETLSYEATRAGLEKALVLGLIQVESAFRKYAISTSGARGYMQVMPFWMRLIGDGRESQLFHTQTNLRFGCVILRHYLQFEQGDLMLALGRYNGSRGQMPYATAVLAARRQWQEAGA